MLASNIDQNLNFGKAVILFKKTGETGFFDLGNAPNCELLVEIEKYEHYSSRFGVKYKDVEKDILKKLMGTIELEEHSNENIAMAFSSTAPTTATQSATTLSGTSVTTVSDRFVDIGYIGATYTKISIGTVSDGPFTAGETITGTSTKTATVIDVQAGYLLVVGDTGIELTETITGGTSTASAAVTGKRVISGILLADNTAAASITTVYTKGTDYSYQAEGGMIRELSDGSIAAHTAYIYADIPAKTKSQFAVLAGSSITGQLMIIGTTEAGYGPRMKFISHDNDKVKLTCTGGVKFITDEPQAITFDVEILADTETYPDEPFGVLETIV
jgi:hypothetical protein